MCLANQIPAGRPFCPSNLSHKEAHGRYNYEKIKTFTERLRRVVWTCYDTRLFGSNVQLMHLKSMSQRAEAMLEKVVPLDLECGVNLETGDQGSSSPSA